MALNFHLAYVESFVYFRASKLELVAITMQNVSLPRLEYVHIQ